MGRLSKITAGILNIRLHPHPDGVYHEFIDAVFKLRKPVRVHGERWAMMSLISKNKTDPDLVTGLISTFTKIELDQPWFDAENLKDASEDILAEIEIPENVFPNSSSFNFAFDTKKHKLYVQTYSKGKAFSINLANNMFQTLVDDLRITRKFGLASIDVVQSNVGLERIFEIKVLKKLTFILNKPNADVFEDDFDENVESYLREIKAKKMQIGVVAESGQSIEPNDSLKRIGSSALEHGSVVGEGADNQGLAVTRSSRDFPREISEKYDANEEQENLVFRKMIGR